MATKKYPPKKVVNHIITAPVKHNWSEYQKAIFKDIAQGKGHTVVIARAGAAKTSSIIEGFKYIPKGKKSLMCAFNKSIADELKERAGSYVEVCTLHSLGFRAIKLAFGDGVQVDNYKTQNIVKKFLGDDRETWDLNASICKTVSLCKGFLWDTPTKISDIIDKFDIDLFEMTDKRDAFISMVIQTMSACKAQKMVIDFDDMIWFPFVYRLSVGKFDYVFVDELQDLSDSQIEMVISTLKPTSRAIAVGDNFQAIYSFRGANCDAVFNFISRLNAKVLKLPISYRCPKIVIELAQTMVPDIQCPSTAIEGQIHNMQEDDLVNKVLPGDFVISRTNAPLIKNCLRLLKAGIPANIKGRDIGANLTAFIKKSKAKTVIDFRQYVLDWQRDENERLIRERKDTGAANDKAECLLNLSEDAKTVEEIKERIDKLFKDVDDSKKVILGSTHKMKGLEANRVFLLQWTYRYNPVIEAEKKLALMKEKALIESDDDWSAGENGEIIGIDISKDEEVRGLGEEVHLFYVAITRAKKELFLVKGKAKAANPNYAKYDSKKKNKSKDFLGNAKMLGNELFDVLNPDKSLVNFLLTDDEVFMEEHYYANDED